MRHADENASSWPKGHDTLRHAASAATMLSGMGPETRTSLGSPRAVCSS